MFRSIFTMLTLCLAAASASTALAAPPSNDNFAGATVITSLPLSDQVDNTTATLEAGEPQCSSSPRTVWYSYSPATTGVVKVDMAGSSFFDTAVAVYQSTGGGFVGLSLVPNGCANFSDSVYFNAQSGTTYYFQAADNFTGGGDLHLNVQVISPPANDPFASAIPISSLPFNAAVDMTAATTEPSEPLLPSGSGTPIGASTWYSFTSQSTELLSVTGDTGSFYFGTILAVYTGNSLASLTEVGSRAGEPTVTFRADAGVTYYFQLGIPTLSLPSPAPMSFQLRVTPPLVASFFFYPGDPSVLDTVQFYDQSFDPVEEGFQPQQWDFGDGATATGCCPTHRYTVDRDYTVRLTVTTLLGRTASTTQVVHVRTHDVAITKVSVPQSATAGQTRQITVGVKNTRYPETVQIQLLKSAAGGSFEQIAVLTQSVPVRGGNRTTAFNFSYTFTGADAAIGKVTFRAIAGLINARDALPADNEAIALPTKVSR